MTTLRPGPAASLVERGAHVLLGLGSIDAPTRWVTGEVLWFGDGQIVVQGGLGEDACCDLYPLGCLCGVLGAPVSATLPAGVTSAFQEMRS